jgi:hypothetical protein
MEAIPRVIPHTVAMKISGVLPSDAPDPRIEIDRRIRESPLRPFGLRPQASLTRSPLSALIESRTDGGLTSFAVSSSYTLWRYPDDRSDPRNRVDVDDDTRRVIEEAPAHGRPAWFTDLSRMLLYPMLFEATRTSWFADPSDPSSSLSAVLSHHVEHVRRNGPHPPSDQAHGQRPQGSVLGSISGSVVEGAVRVNGSERAGVHDDSDPDVYGLGFRIDEHSVCTTVVRRDALGMIDLDHVLVE